MKNRLIIKCLNSFDSIDWVVLSANGDIISNDENDSLSELIKKVKLDHCHIHLLMGTSDLLIKNVNLPKKYSATHFKKIVPNILEEDLVSNIESIHFSYGKIQNSEIAVAIIALEKLQNWLETLKQFNIQPDAIYPLCLSMNYNPNEWHVWVENNACIVRTNAMMGFYIETQLLPTLLHRLYLDEQVKPQKIVISGKDQHTVKSISFAQYNELNSLIDYNKHHVWDAFNTELRTINLLHHSFSKAETVSQKKQFIIQGILFLSFIVCAFIGFEIKDIISYSKIKQKQTSEIATIYKNIYPEATTVVSPKQRIERDLNKLQTKTGSVFYDSLYQAGEALTRYKSITLKHISYKNQALTITLESTDYAEIEKLIANLKDSNLIVNQNKTEQNNDKLNTILTITRKSVK